MKAAGKAAGGGGGFFSHISFGFAETIRFLTNSNYGFNEEEVVSPGRDGETQEQRIDRQYAADLNDTSLPRIIVIGDENAGKSSTLERIVGVSLLPRDKKLCSRQPIVLMLRAIPATVQPYFTLKIPGNLVHTGQDHILEHAVVKEAIVVHMEAIKKEFGEYAIIADSEIEVGVYGHNVTTLDLVDLPGLFSMGQNECEQVKACVEKYITHEKTGAIFCVVSSATENLRTSLATAMLEKVFGGALLPERQESDELTEEEEQAKMEKERLEKVRNNVTGVFSKFDKAGEVEKVEEWLTSGGDQFCKKHFPVGNEYVRQYFTRGAVAVINCDTADAAKRGVPERSLEEQAIYEEKQFLEADWTLSGTPTYDSTGKETLTAGGFVSLGSDGVTKCLAPFGRSVLGINALVERLDSSMRHYLKDGWAPIRITLHEKTIDECEAELVTLGLDPQAYTSDQLLRCVDKRINTVLHARSLSIEAKIGENFEAVVKEVIERFILSNAGSLNPPSEAPTTFLPSVALLVQLKSSIVDVLQEYLTTGKLFLEMTDLLLGVVKEAFEEDPAEQGSQLQRFVNLHTATLCAAKASFASIKHDFDERLSSLIGRLRDMSISVRFRSQNELSDFFVLGLQEMVVEILYLPFTSQGFVHLPFQVKQTGADQFKFVSSISMNLVEVSSRFPSFSPHLPYSLINYRDLHL